MAWTNPATVTVAEMIDAAWMNTYVRDQLNVVNDHNHQAGATGEGSDNLQDVVTATFTDQSAPGLPGAGWTYVYAATGGGIHQKPNAGDETLSVVGHAH